MSASATTMDMCDKVGASSSTEHLISFAPASNGGAAFLVDMSCQMPVPDQAEARDALAKRSADRLAALSRGTARRAGFVGRLRRDAIAAKAKKHNEAVADQLERYRRDRQRREHDLKAQLEVTHASKKIAERAAKASQHNDMVAWRRQLHREQHELLMDVLNTRLHSVTEAVTAATERALKARQHNEMVTLKYHHHNLSRHASQELLKSKVSQKSLLTVTDHRASKAAEHNEIVAWKVQNVAEERSLRSHLLEAKLSQQARPRSAEDRALKARHHNEAVARHSQNQFVERHVLAMVPGELDSASC